MNLTVAVILTELVCLSCVPGSVISSDAVSALSQQLQQMQIEQRELQMEQQRQLHEIHRLNGLSGGALHEIIQRGHCND